MAKPHIAKLVTTGRWCCTMRKTNPGFGMTPRSAYRDWELENQGPRIDLSKYAGTYGGSLPDQAMTAHATWWMLAWAAWESCKRFIVGCLVAAVILWLLWG